ncbi:MAG: CDP-alcohol phosphatidyltransferase family protein [Candidatus Dadabacteria bacterium]|nr:MAG: CDP-alcohol phosphatidyltransferase family protein [Candidatus Dadabacteria bacterium]
MQSRAGWPAGTSRAGTGPLDEPVARRRPQRFARAALLPWGISLLRPALGILLLTWLPAHPATVLALPATAMAVLSDWLDGRLARAGDCASEAGRLVDNLCDCAFLSAAFYGFGRAAVWSDPHWGRAVRYWSGVNWLPLLATLAAFGAYFARWGLCRAIGVSLAPSARGRQAGVANWALAVTGAVAVLPGVRLGPWVLEPAFLTVVLLDITAAVDNLLLALAAALGRDRRG